MKYSVAVIAFAAGAFALPQEASVTSAPSASASLSPSLQCVSACAAGDVTCQAACLGNARPNESQVNETTECAANCDQGDGSPEATDAYAKCQQDCFQSLFPSSQTAFGAGGSGASVAKSAASAAASATNSLGSVISTAIASATKTSAQSGAEASGSESASGAAASETTGAASSNSVKLVGAGFAGLMAIFAL